MIDNKQKFFQKELARIDRQLQSVTGIKGRHKLIKRQRELKKELRNFAKRKK